MIRRLFPRFWARRDYFAADTEAAQAWAEFADPAGDPWSRVQALKTAANCAGAMADTSHGFRGASERDEDGFTLAQSHGMAALLLDLVADTEAAAYDFADSGRRRSNLDEDPTVATVVGRLRAEPWTEKRAVLTLALHDAVVGRVGVQAAEPLTAVARGYYLASGMSLPEANWRTSWRRPSGGDQS